MLQTYSDNNDCVHGSKGLNRNKMSMNNVGYSYNFSFSFEYIKESI